VTQSQGLLRSNGSSELLSSKQNYWLEIVLMHHLARFLPFNFFIQAGVLGVALLEYLPENMLPPDLVIMPPMGCATVAILPDPVAPVVAFSAINSLALIQNPQ
jgi:hypothetical protein